MRYLEIQNRIAEAASAAGRDPREIKLIAVTKNVPWDTAVRLYDAGQRDFAESRLEEAVSKIQLAPPDCRWHLIGTLQRNKVRKAIGRFALIHSVDTLDLAKKLSSLAAEMQLVCSILLQVNTSGELSKHGFAPEECRRRFLELCHLPGLSIQGLMTIAPFTEDQALIRRCFSALRELREELASRAPPQHALKELSMGMSHDFPLAIAEGATLLRIGTALFSAKNNPPKEK
jgi:pyridoxal phosphate enzyme (YggS family)